MAKYVVIFELETLKLSEGKHQEAFDLLMRLLKYNDQSSDLKVDSVLVRDENDMKEDQGILFRRVPSKA